MSPKVVAKAMLVAPDGRVLVLRRAPDDEHDPGRADFPGGSVELGESYTAAIAREINEETGVNVTEQDLRLVYAFTAEAQARGVPLIRLLYAVNVFNMDVVLSHEHDAYSWYAPSGVQERFTDISWGSAIQFVRKHNLLNAKGNLEIA